MAFGMMWYDPSKKKIAEKLGFAAEYYKKKYGKIPNKCYVNRSMLKKKRGGIINGIKIFTSPAILHNHLWIGREVQPGG